MAKCLSDEEVATRIVNIYFQEIARLGLKRSLDLDAIINAYFYTLHRLNRKEKEIKCFADKVRAEEKELATESKEELF